MYDFLKVKNNLYLATVLHGTLFFTENLRKMLKSVNPDIVAVELPSWARDIYIKGIKTLPEVTLLTYESRDKQKYYILIEPTDSFAEAVRFALDNNKKIAFIDSDAISYYENDDPYYESFFIEKESWEDFFNKYKNYKFKKVKQDNLREKTMAYNLKKLSKYDEKIVAVVGMSHYKGIIENLDNDIVSIFASYTPSPKLFSIAPHDLGSLLSDYPLLNWFYENFRLNNRFKIGENNKIKKIKAIFGIIEGKKGNYEERYKEIVEELYNNEILDNSFLKFEDYDRRKLLYKIFKETSKLYKVRYKEEFYSWQLKNMVKFARNISILNGKILPSYFTILESAKANIDDNYTWELMQILGYYSYQPEESHLPQIDINELKNFSSMFIRKREKRPAKNLMKRRKKQKKDEDWSKKFDRGSMCSHQPEDIIIEDFADFIKLRAKRHLLSELIKSEKFSTSFFEGIDIKETIRKQDGIYVKKYEKLQGEIGNVVFIFDTDPEDKKYKYKMTWLGEHDQESDMSFYSTEIGDDIIGPGISRCEYGGFMLSYPPGRLYDVWGDPDYSFFKDKEDKLLLAAIDYSQKRYVVYVAKKPPKSKIVSWGKRNGIDVVYIPIGALSKSTLNKIKIFHVLAGHDVREDAGDYIF